MSATKKTAKEQPKEEVTDFSELYAAQKEQFKPWAKAFLVWFFIFIATPPIFILFNIDLRIYLMSLPIMFIALFPLAVKMYIALRCPGCGKYMGRNFGEFCTKCGVRLRYHNS